MTTSEDARTVWPGRGKASTVNVRSALTLPTTQTRAAITVKASPALLPDTCRTRERGSIRWVNECASPYAARLALAGPRRRPPGPRRGTHTGDAEHRNQEPRAACRGRRRARPRARDPCRQRAGPRSGPGRRHPGRHARQAGAEPQRVDGIAAGLRQVAGLPDPIGEVLRGRTLPNGLQLRQQRVPLGVVGIVYEGRPNVTVDAFGSDTQVRQRGAAAWQLVGGPVERGARHHTARSDGRRGTRTRCRAAASQRGPRQRDTSDPGPRPGRRRDPARGSRPDRRGGARRDGADHRDRCRQLPCLRS